MYVPKEVWYILICKDLMSISYLLLRTTSYNGVIKPLTPNDYSENCIVMLIYCDMNSTSLYHPAIALGWSSVLAQLANFITCLACLSQGAR